MTQAAAALLRREAEAAGAVVAAATGAAGAEAAAPPPPAPPGSFEGWHVAGAGASGAGGDGGGEQQADAEQQGAAAAAGASSGGAAAAAAWWARPAAQWAPDERLLAAGARVVAALREAVEARLGFTCSAGVSHSKVLAKLASGLHKPRQQTLVPAAAVGALLAPLPLSRLRSLGGKFGDAVAARLAGGGGGDDRGGDGARPPATVGDLAALPVERLVAWFGDDAGPWCAAPAFSWPLRPLRGPIPLCFAFVCVYRGKPRRPPDAHAPNASSPQTPRRAHPCPPRLYRLARGQDGERVAERRLAKSVGCGKTFRGPAALRDLAAAHRWLLEVGRGGD